MSQMTMRDISNWAAAQVEAIADALEVAGAPRPHVYKWWEEGMELPAAYLWLAQPRGDSEAVDMATIRDNMTIILTVALRPRSNTGSDLLDVEEVIDVALPLLNAAVKELARAEGVRARATRGTPRLAVDSDWGGTDAQKVVTVEIPISIPWHQHI